MNIFLFYFPAESKITPFVIVLSALTGVFNCIQLVFFRLKTPEFVFCKIILYYFCNKIYNYMKTPTIKTTKGQNVPITKIGDNNIIEAFLETATESDDIEIVRLLISSITDKNEAGKVLRRCLTENKTLTAVYPGNGETAPKNAEYIGDIEDGALYLI